MAAVAYGPVVLAGDMGTEGEKSPVPFAHDQLDYKDYPIPADIIRYIKCQWPEIKRLAGSGKWQAT